jgi:tetratricopeptide (TPR) repeat protein
MESRSGELATRPLPAVLLDLHEELATGRLLLRRGRVSKSVDLVNGNPVSTASTPRDETLGHFLVATGVITEDEHRRAVSHAAETSSKLGEALVSMQILSVEQLIDQLGKQARHKLVQALRWPQGAWRFDPAKEAIEGMQLRMVEVVLSGLRETAVEDLARLARLDGMTFELTERGKRLRHELRRTFGERSVAQLASGSSIAELEKTFPDRAQARIAIDAMLLCDAVTSKAAQLGLGAAAPAAAQSRTRTRPSNPEELYAILFDDVGVPQQVSDDFSSPLDFDAPQSELDIPDSGVVSIEDMKHAEIARERETAIQKVITAEAQRIQGADHYAILLVDRDADAEDVDAAFQVKLTMLDRNTAKVGDPRDRAKIAFIRESYARAAEVLTDSNKRAAYDRELAGGELHQVPPSMNAEMSFRVAEELMAKHQWTQAIGTIRTVLTHSPAEAAYHAALGWAEWNAGTDRAAAADAARQHLNQALSINPDHPAAHDYKGRIEAAVRTDDANALFHLERAIDLDPSRYEALDALEALLITRGELKRLERVLKRLLFRLRGRGGVIEGIAWLRLGRVYLEHLDDATAANAAIENARKLAPDHPDVVELSSRAAHQRSAVGDPIRAGWREALQDPHSGAQLVRSTEASGHADAAFLAASTMVALGTADDAMAKFYEQHRVRTVELPGMPLGRDQWALLRHPADTVELGALLELVAPAVHLMAPMTLADGDLDDSQRVADADLPPVFGDLRIQLATLIGVETAPVYARPELGGQIHVVACEPPVMVAGDDALTASATPELVFRLARATTFLWPGRAVGASRPGRVLRAVVLAVVREASGTELGADDPLAAGAAAAVARLDADQRGQARAAAIRLLSMTGGGLNLSLWARSLSRTADRAGMVLCGDVPAAFAGAREVGDLDRDLVDFAFSAAHVQLRSQLGMRRG